MVKLIKLIQDGAAVHCQVAFMRQIDDIFEGKVIALGADKDDLRGVEWAPR